MFFFRNDKIINEEDESIEILISRLEHSEYLEDKYEALHDLLIHAERNILETGSYGMVPLIESIRDLENINKNIEILQMIFKSKHGDEFIDLLLKNINLVQILVDNINKDRKGFIKLLLILTLNKDFCRSFVKLRNASYYAVDFMDINVLLRLINLDNNFDKEIVFEGIFEKLIYLNINESTFNDYNSKDLLNKLLLNNHFNQNYFIETEWSKILKNDSFNIHYLIDNTNINNQYIKDSVYKIYNFEEALSRRDYQYIYRMVYGSKKYREIIREIFWGETYESVYQVKDDQEKIDDEKIQLNDEEDKIQLIDDKVDDEEDKIQLIDDKKQLINKKIDHVINKNILLIYYFMHKNILKFEYSGFVYLIYSEILHDSIKEPDINIPLKKYDLIYELVTKNVNILSKILLLFSFRNIDHDITLSLSDININTVMYFIVLGQSESIINQSYILLEKINDEESDPDFRRLCIFLCNIHNIRLNFNNHYIIENCKSVRRLIVNADNESDLFTIDEATNLIIDKLNELIDRYSINQIY